MPWLTILRDVLLGGLTLAMFTAWVGVFNYNATPIRRPKERRGFEVIQKESNGDDKPKRDGSHR
ncbi:MAG TPA: hypothetical protein VGI81_00680 [Tepidisphaeraceae bacterium]|jgi:hypothetical protein